ncbi:monofunctional biosynthetic peptidoglycan transglycosylase [Sinomicrobium weinanense]|uniref:Biosynthetic peptidoglycan transglycosylase n=1 Tax=Sinomicrobium weinanense TaxID=2842200 RepID=A0A926JRD3_9FLAO|nr:monofunctional biosynthetic peptidoglycan transglycosylase [Sinomicrobium weinanense]MBC9795882.1 monofunctional biosynthetic peptidoglycan transglycosylase [Sinomicrobium weinanense]MBU3125402.1 monofunctional biosynthetic peptidoglycan transglycosylase [Sinomicrobium weinanense]
MIKRIVKFTAKCIFGFVLVSFLIVLLLKWCPVYITPLMAIRSIEQKQEGRSVVIKHDWIPLKKISENLQLAVICSEDQNFTTHSGFDLKAIEKAYENNKKGKHLRGASTISQQTAKNVFLWPKRSWLRKGLEAYFTFLIELLWSKERILEVYLNSVEMGDGIYGAEAAAIHWFNMPAESLNKRQAAAIAAILPSPRNYIANPPSGYIQGRINWITRQMRYYGRLEFP